MRGLAALVLMAGILAAAYRAPYQGDETVFLTRQVYQRIDPAEEADIFIEYAQAGGLQERNVQEAVNEVLRREAFSDWQPDEEKGIRLEIVQTPVIFQNYLSVTTWTDCYIASAAHPWCSLSARVIDLNTGEPVRLGDLVAVDEGIREKIYGGAFKNDRFSHEECLKMYWYERLSDSIVGKGDRTGGFYLTDQGIGFIIDVSHVEGDYLTFEIGYDELGVDGNAGGSGESVLSPITK